MSKFFSHLRSTVIAGVIFLIPVFVVVLIIQKIYSGLTGFGHELAKMLGIKSIAGIGAASIGTTLILISVFYACGWLVRVAMISNLRAWVENNLLLYIPGYLNYKVKMEEKLIPKKEERISARIRTGDITRMGFLIHRENGKCTVLVPNTPDTDTGQVWIVDEHQVTEMAMNEKDLLIAIRHSGRGLKF